MRERGIDATRRQRPRYLLEPAERHRIHRRHVLGEQLLRLRREAREERRHDRDTERATELARQVEHARALRQFAHFELGHGRVGERDEDQSKAHAAHDQRPERFLRAAGERHSREPPHRGEEQHRTNGHRRSRVESIRVSAHESHRDRGRYRAGQNHEARLIRR